MLTVWKETCHYCNSTAISKLIYTKSIQWQWGIVVHVTLTTQASWNAALHLVSIDQTKQGSTNFKTFLQPSNSYWSSKKDINLNV